LFHDKKLGITIFAALAQLEGESISDNTKWGIEQSLHDPKSKLLSRPCYGYRRSADGTSLEIYEEEAEVVRFIFQLRNSGMGYRKILQNEKYRGEVLFFKRFIEDYPGKRRKKNRGEHVQYHCKDHHPAIID